MKAIQTQAIITGVRSRVDKSLGLSISTPELTTDQKVEFLNLQGINCKFTIEPLDVEPSDLVTIEKDMEGKSQSTRIRSVLFILWKQENEPGDFQTYYRDYTEKIITHLKSKIEN